MKIKHLLLIMGILALFSTNLATAQTLRKSSILSRTHFRVEAGFTASKISNFGPESSTLYSFRAGPTASIPIDFSDFEISTGLIFTQKGEHSSGGLNVEQTLNPTYLVIPIDLSYRIDIDDDGCFYVNGGPYIGIGIVGSNKNYSFKSAFDDNGLLKRSEVGIGLSGMLEYNNYTFRVGGEIGITSPINKKDWALSDRAPRSFQIYLTLGYRLFNW